MGTYLPARMLYDFHSQQNAKKPGTIHATYLLSGAKRKEEPAATNGGIKKDGEGDQYMQSSPFMSSMPQEEEGTGESSVLSISLIREEELERRSSKPDSITLLNNSQVNALSTSNLPRYIFTA